MKSITFNTGEFEQEKTSAWLVVFIRFGQTIGTFDLLEQVKVKMKEVDYSVPQKFITLLLSVAIGCRYSNFTQQKHIDKYWIIWQNNIM